LPFVDTHLHLEELEHPGAAVTEAVEAGVGRLITMGTDLATSTGALALAEQRREVYAAVGHQPMNREAPDLDALRSLAAHEKAVAIGEVGVDGGHTELAALPLQVEWFASLCDLALELGLPVCVHTRDSAEEVFGVLRARPGLTGVMHYFSLDGAWAGRFLELGFHLSFAGLLTRPSRQELREVARTCPPDRLLLETDAPFGTPHGRRAKQNRPAWLLDTAKVVAELRRLSLEELAAIEETNAKSLFSKLG